MRTLLGFEELNIPVSISTGSGPDKDTFAITGTVGIAHIPNHIFVDGTTNRIGAEGFHIDTVVIGTCVG